MRECYRRLEGHDGMVSFSARTREAQCARDVNDLQLDVSEMRDLHEDQKSIENLEGSVCR